MVLLKGSFNLLEPPNSLRLKFELINKGIFFSYNISISVINLCCILSINRALIQLLILIMLPLSLFLKYILILYSKWTFWAILKLPTSISNLNTKLRLQIYNTKIASAAAFTLNYSQFWFIYLRAATALVIITYILIL